MLYSPYNESQNPLEVPTHHIVHCNNQDNCTPSNPTLNRNHKFNYQVTSVIWYRTNTSKLLVNGSSNVFTNLQVLQFCSYYCQPIKYFGLFCDIDFNATINLYQIKRSKATSLRNQILQSTGVRLQRLILYKSVGKWPC